MPKFKLICDHSCDLDTHIVTHEFTADYLPEVLLNIDMFLKGAGYVYDGEVDIVNQPHTTCDDKECEQHSDHFYDINRNR